MTCAIHGRKRNIAVVAAIVVMVVLVLVAVLAPILVLAVQREGGGVLVVATFGDSITDVGSYGKVMDQNQFPFGYQATMYTEFKQMGIQSKIHNYGIGGQVVRQIVDRLPMSVSADYITILAGINDVNTADYASSVNATQILTDSITQTMTDGVNSVLAHRPPETKVVIGTIPPFCTLGAWGQLEAKRDAIVYINKRLRLLVSAWNSTRILLADVFADMATDGEDGWRLERCCPQDRLHFTPQANIICGQAFSRAIRRDWLSNNR